MNAATLKASLLAFLKKYSAILIVLAIDLGLLTYSILFFLLKGTPYFILVGSPECVLWHLHLYCLGCGGTRSVTALLQGDILQSLRLNPMPILWGSMLLFENIHTVVAYIRAKIKGLPLPSYPYYGILLWIALFFTGGYWILQNILLLFGVDIIGDHGSFWPDLFASL